MSSSSDSSKPLAEIYHWVSPTSKTGEFQRQASQFRNWISTDEGAEFPPEKGRYHLYVSYACPWAHRTLIVRKLKGLEDIISYTAVHWYMGENGWRFATAADSPADVPGSNVTPDPHHAGITHLRQIYLANDPGYAGRFTVPVLYDIKTQRIVNNESSEIIRMLNGAFDQLLPGDSAGAKLDLYPEKLREQIDEANEWIYDGLNNGVYKSGFATTQEAYERACRGVFASLDRVESQLRRSGGGKFFFGGDGPTETDVRLFTTLVRFDPVYVQHFKLNLRDVRSGYPAVHAWLRRLYWDVEAFRDTTEFTHIKRHYTRSHKNINPLSITPLGPEPDILPKDEEVNAVKASKI